MKLYNQSKAVGYLRNIFKGLDGFAHGDNVVPWSSVKPVNFNSVKEVTAGVDGFILELALPRRIDEFLMNHLGCEVYDKEEGKVITQDLMVVTSLMNVVPPKEVVRAFSYDVMLSFGFHSPCPVESEMSRQTVSAGKSSNQIKGAAGITCSLDGYNGGFMFYEILVGFGHDRILNTLSCLESICSVCKASRTITVYSIFQLEKVAGIMNGGL